MTIESDKVKNQQRLDEYWGQFKSGMKYPERYRDRVVMKMSKGFDGQHSHGSESDVTSTQDLIQLKVQMKQKFDLIEQQVIEFKELLRELDEMRFKIELEKVERKTDV